MLKLLIVSLMGTLFFSCTRNEENETAQHASEEESDEKLVILSPHRKSIQEEFIPHFQEYYKNNFDKEVYVEWLDQGGTSASVRFLNARYASNSETSGVDVFWGGGASNFIQLDRDGYLESFELSDELAAQIPERMAGVGLRNPDATWHASAISGYGIFYNKRALEMYGLKAPKTWKDLRHPRFQNQLSLTDARQSGTASIMNMIVLQGFGWKEGWSTLTAIAANTNHFTHSSSDPVRAVVTGDALAAMVIDFYALAQIADMGEEKLGFAIPDSQTILDPDPIGILKGAPNRKVAERFVEYVLKPEQQALLMLPQGAEGGPNRTTLGRMAVNQKAYELTKGRRISDLNPFELDGVLDFDMDRASRVQRVMNDLTGALFVDTHSELKSGWNDVVSLVDGEVPASLLWEFSKPPLSEDELLELAEKWDDDRLRNRKINEWVEFAQEKYNQSFVEEAVGQQ